MNQPIPLIIHCINDPSQNQQYKEIIIKQKVEQSNYKVTENKQTTEQSAHTNKIHKFSLGLISNLSGQTNILLRFKSNQFKQVTLPTTIDFQKITLTNHSQQIELDVWDFNSVQWFEKTCVHFYKNIKDCVFFVFRIDNRETFQHLRKVNANFNQHGNPNVIKVLVGNCSDLDKDRQVSEAEAKQFLQKINGAFFMEVSAKTGHNIHYLFAKTTEFLKQKFIEEKSEKPLVESKVETKPQKKKSWWILF